MMKFAYFLLSSFVVVACQYSHRLAEEVEKQELAYRSDSTTTIDMEECAVVQKRSIHTHDYLVQNFYTSENAKGLFVMDLHHNRPMFIKEVVNDMDNVVRFNFDFTKFYDVRQDLFASVTDVYFKGIHTEEEIEEGTSQLSDSVRSILVRAKGEEGINPILMFYRLKKDIVK